MILQALEDAQHCAKRQLRVKWTRSIPGQMGTLVACLIAVVVLSGCAWGPVDYPQLGVNQAPHRPTNVFVYNFAATIEDVSVSAPLAARLSTRPALSAQQVAMERQLGAEMSAQLVEAIRAMGLRAEHASPEMTPQVNDIVVRGYLVSIRKAQATQRFAVGLDPEASDFAVAVENFQIMPQGYGRSLGTGSVTDGERALGAAVGAAENPAGHIVASAMKNETEANRSAKIEMWSRNAVAEIADRLKARFQEQGWIN